MRGIHDGRRSLGRTELYCGTWSLGVIPDAAHLANIEQPEAVTQAIPDHPSPVVREGRLDPAALALRSAPLDGPALREVPARGAALPCAGRSATRFQPLGGHPDYRAGSRSPPERRNACVCYFEVVPSRSEGKGDPGWFSQPAVIPKEEIWALLAYPPSTKTPIRLST